MSTVETELRETVAAVTPRLLALSESEASRQPAPGKWSPKEVIGHLVDSASNNHQRFVRAGFTEDLVFPGYQQEEWVKAQHYGTAPWTELVGLWSNFNLHLARVIGATPADVRQKPRVRHNLPELAWKAVPQHEPATLEYFMRDYVDHLRHHIAQIFPPA